MLRALVNLAVLPVLATIALADTIHVPADQPTIQAGINTAVNGDTVLVAPGTYVENIDFLGKAIVVKSCGGAHKTVIDGNQAGSVVCFHNAEGRDSRLDGFTLRNGKAAYVAGIDCLFASTSIFNNIIRENAAGFEGGGIFCDGFQTLLVGNVILDNEVRKPGIPWESTEVNGGFYYCQEPDYIQIYNMSSGFDAEIADDIPLHLAGYRLKKITLWVGQWFTSGGGTWRDPEGVRVNFYHESGPPEMDPFSTVEVAWRELSKTLVHSSSDMRVYEVQIFLSPMLLLEAGMSLGATALIDWGHDEPFTGICATPFGISYGQDVAYLDGSWWGYVRWTAINYFTNIDQDLAYGLSGYKWKQTPSPNPPKMQ